MNRAVWAADMRLHPEGWTSLSPRSAAWTFWSSGELLNRGFKVAVQGWAKREQDCVGLAVSAPPPGCDCLPHTQARLLPALPHHRGAGRRPQPQGGCARGVSERASACAPRCAAPLVFCAARNRAAPHTDAPRHTRLRPRRSFDYELYTRTDIERILGDKAWCISFKDSACRCFGYMVSKKKYIYTVGG